MVIEPIFTSIQQCLHVAFLIGTLPATQKSQMQVLVEKMQEQSGIGSDAVRSTVNFGGLTALEIRGQCAMVRGAVVHRLPAQEAAALHARYAHERQKAAGVRGVIQYCRTQLATQHQDAVLALGWNVYGTAKQRAGLSLRDIAHEYSLALASLGRDRQKMVSMIDRLEGAAIDRLSERFALDGLIPQT